MVDVVAIGETMIRISPKGFDRLEFTNELDMKVGGTESNFCVALSRLGMKAAWISKLTNNQLGHRVENEIQRWGVDTSKIIWTNDHRVGVYFLEFGSRPRPTSIIYDRKNSAISNINVKEVDWDFVKKAKILHLTGITPALSENCEYLVLYASELMRKQNKIVSFDVNYRSKLWSPERARKSLQEILPNVNILLSSEQDIETIFDLKMDTKAKCRELMERFHNDVVVLTRGPEDPIALDYDGNEYKVKNVLPAVVDRIGAGDAFDAGFIYGYLTEGIAKGMKYASALSSLKFSIPGDLAIISKEEIDQFLESEDYKIRR